MDTKERARERARQWRIDNQERSRRNALAAHYREKWGVTVEEVDSMIDAQGGVCKLCRKPDPRGIRLSIDHDHKTGRFRGMLCTRCNWTLLGGCGDDPEFYERVVQYLQGILDQPEYEDALV